MSDIPPPRPPPSPPPPPPPTQADGTLKRAVRRAGTAAANHARRRTRRSNISPSPSPAPAATRPRSATHTRSRSSPTVVSALASTSTSLPSCPPVAEESRPSSTVDAVAHTGLPTPPSSRSATPPERERERLRRALKAPLDLRARLRPRRPSLASHSPPPTVPSVSVSPSRRSDDLRQTLLSFPEHDATTVSTLFKRYHGDRTRVIAKLQEFRHRARDTPAPASAPSSRPRGRPRTPKDPPPPPPPPPPPSPPPAPARSHSPPPREDRFSPSLAPARWSFPSLAGATPIADFTSSAAPFLPPFPPLALADPTAPFAFGTPSPDGVRHPPFATAPGSDASSAASSTPASPPSGLPDGPARHARTTAAHGLSPSASRGEKRRRSPAVSELQTSSYGDTASSRSPSTPYDPSAAGSASSSGQAPRPSPSDVAPEFKIEGPSLHASRDSATDAPRPRRHTAVPKPRPPSLNDAKLQNSASFRGLSAKVERLERTLKQFQENSLAVRRELMRKIDRSESERRALEQRHQALMHELDESQKKLVKTDKYLDIMRTDLHQAINQRQSRFFAIARAGLHNILYYLLAYLVPVFAFLIRGIRDAVIVVRRRSKARRESRMLSTMLKEMDAGGAEAVGIDDSSYSQEN